MKFNTEQAKFIIRQNKTNYKELAKQMETSYAYFCNVINKGSTSLAFLTKLADILKVGIEDLTKEGEIKTDFKKDSDMALILKEKEGLIIELKRGLQDKEKIIEMLEKQIEDLERRIKELEK